MQVAVIGVGSFGRNHARVYKELAPEGVELAAVVDANFPRAVLDRFHAEARVLADLHHPHVALAYDAGRLPRPAPQAAALHYLVMELVTGGDLEHYVYDRGRVPVAQAW